MHLQVLSSGSEGNCTLVRAGEAHVLVDAGLPIDALLERLGAARVSPRRIGHIALTHGHLDHARSAGLLANKAQARVHCCERLTGNASLRAAPELACLTIGRPRILADPAGRPELSLLPVKIPHDADPTVAFLLEQEGRRAVVLTDMGHADLEVARKLAGAHLIVLEFNHDARLLRGGPYPAKLKRRVASPLGHLSNDEAARMLTWLAGPELHTVVLAHLSRTNNRPELALECARRALQEAGLGEVRLLIADQHQIGPNLTV